MKVINNNTLVKLGKNTTILGNGLSINNENQNRKDIVSGSVYLSDKFEEGTTIWFPLYAASIITLTQGEFYIVNNEDVLVIEND